MFSDAISSICVLLALPSSARIASATAGSASASRAVKKPCGLDVGKVGRGGHQSLSCKKVGELVDAALVAPAGEIGAEEGGDAGPGHVAADQPRAEREDIGVIMLAGQRCRQRVVDPRAAAGRVAVDGDRNADARAADGDPALGVAGWRSPRASLAPNCG